MYPPNTPSTLHELHKRIVNAPIALHYKHSLLFYLLKDLSPSHHSDPELASAFAANVHLEKKFWTFVEGLWELDHLHCETAVGNLTHPSIIPTFPDEIMLVLLQQVGKSGELNGSVLPLAYYNCANPPLAGQEVREEFVKYLAGRNVPETYTWIRTRPDYEKEKLMEVLVEAVLEGGRWGEEDELYSREEKGVDLISLPFAAEEEAWFELYLTEGNGRNFRGAWDTVQMRRIATGRLVQAVDEGASGKKGRKHDGVNWEVLVDAVGRGLGPRRDEESPVVV